MPSSRGSDPHPLCLLHWQVGSLPLSATRGALTHLCRLSLFTSGWPRRRSAYQNILATKIPLKMRLPAHTGWHRMYLMLYRRGAPRWCTRRTALKHELWVLKVSHRTPVCTLLTFVDIRKRHESFNSLFFKGHTSQIGVLLEFACACSVASVRSASLRPHGL